LLFDNILAKYRSQHIFTGPAGTEQNQTIPIPASVIERLGVPLADRFDPLGFLAGWDVVGKGHSGKSFAYLQLPHQPLDLIRLFYGLVSGLLFFHFFYFNPVAGRAFSNDHPKNIVLDVFRLQIAVFPANVQVYLFLLASSQG
jgi:hypothetical protein